MPKNVNNPHKKIILMKTVGSYKAACSLRDRSLDLYQLVKRVSSDWVRRWTELGFLREGRIYTIKKNWNKERQQYEFLLTQKNTGVQNNNNAYKIKDVSYVIFTFHRFVRFNFD